MLTLFVCDRSSSRRRRRSSLSAWSVRLSLRPRGAGRAVLRRVVRRENDLRLSARMVRGRSRDSYIVDALHGCAYSGYHAQLNELLTVRPSARYERGMSLIHCVINCACRYLHLN